MIQLPFWVFIVGLVMLLFGVSFFFGMWREACKRVRKEENAHTHNVQRLNAKHEDEIADAHRQIKQLYSSLAAYKGHQTRQANAMLTGKSMPTKPVPKVKEYLIREQP
jgi:hypothetical protein